MRRYQKKELRRSQASVRYSLSPRNEKEKEMFSRKDYFVEHYARMFIEDVGVLVLRVPLYDEAAENRVNLTPPDTRATRIISDALERHRVRSDLGRATRTFFHECAQSIVMDGKAYYEIVLLSDPDTGENVNFELEYVNPRTLLHMQGKLYQYVPEDVSQQFGVPRQIELPADRMLTFTAPRVPGVTFSAMLDRFCEVGRRHIPEFALKGVSDGEATVPFDFVEFRRAQALALADITKEVGWNARGALQGYLSEYYWMRRELLFQRFLIEMRDGILHVLNDGIARVGTALGFASRLSFENVPTQETVDIAQRHLESGDMTFEQIMKDF